MQTQHQQEQFLDLYRHGIRSASDIGQAWLQVRLRLHEKQVEAVRDMIDENARSAQRVTEARSLGELAALQSGLAGAQIRRVAEFWSAVWQGAVENQRAIIGQAQPFSTRSAEEVAR